MRSFNHDPEHVAGGSASVPTGMENDPNADEEIIDQRKGEQYPEPVEPTTEPPKIAPDNVADSIAYAIDGSGPGLTNDAPNVSGHKTITKGVTGAGVDDEEEKKH